MAEEIEEDSGAVLTGGAGAAFRIVGAGAAIRIADVGLVPTAGVGAAPKTVVVAAVGLTGEEGSTAAGEGAAAGEGEGQLGKRLVSS